MNNRLWRVTGSASAKTCTGATLCGLQVERDEPVLERLGHGLARQRGDVPA